MAGIATRPSTLRVCRRVFSLVVFFCFALVTEFSWFFFWTGAARANCIHSVLHCFWPSVFYSRLFDWLVHQTDCFLCQALFSSYLNDVVPSFTGFHWVLLRCIGSYWVTLGYTWLQWVTMGYHGLHDISLTCTGFHLATMGYDG